jgi:DNA-binding MarR family transcriptional regulator
MMQAYAPLLLQLGLTYPQYLVLLILWERDGATVNQLGERLYLDSGTLTPLLQRLVAAGLITRARKKGDERTVENWLTARGRALKRRALSVPIELGCDLGMKDGELVRLRKSLRELVERLATVAPARVRG